ncbi:hypothetical protein HZS_633 [Henneguya salminicola]|nr:hypothetical protein HZS_633 [Henneguya salminicola]
MSHCSCGTAPLGGRGYHIATDLISGTYLTLATMPGGGWVKLILKETSTVIHIQSQNEKKEAVDQLKYLLPNELISIFNSFEKT